MTSFDDVRGFIKPSSLEAGRPEIVPGPWSPYRDELLFVDELSRAPAHQQSRWLQLLHERLVDGQPTSIRWVLAAMNPPSIDGTFPLGLATVDRFMAVLALDDFADLDPDIRLRITLGQLQSPVTLAPDTLVNWMLEVHFYAEWSGLDPLVRLALARIANAAIDGFRRGPDAPFLPQGRRAVLLYDLLRWLLAALSVEVGPEQAFEALGDYLDAALAAGLVNLGRAADCDEAALRRAQDQARREAMRVYDEHDGRGDRPLTVEALLAQPKPSEALTRLASDELLRPSLEIEQVHGLARAWWLAQLPPALRDLGGAR